jgi:hypothetical protein
MPSYRNARHGMGGHGGPPLQVRRFTWAIHESPLRYRHYDRVIRDEDRLNRIMHRDCFGPLRAPRNDVEKTLQGQV